MKFNRKHYGMKRRSSGGQAILEYIIIIALVTVTALTVLGLFGDRIRGLISSSTKAIGGETDDSNKSGLEQLRETGNGEDPINF
ncbi:MAG: hypothetical protein IKP09_05555 [Lentisphaeria bacterium]|nr:hypothetical protein [Lentisphaeria bacterium]